MDHLIPIVFEASCNIGWSEEDCDGILCEVLQDVVALNLNLSTVGGEEMLIRRCNIFLPHRLQAGTNSLSSLVSGGLAVL